MYNIPSKNLCDFFFFHFVSAMTSLQSLHSLYMSSPQRPCSRTGKMPRIVEVGISSSSVFEICSCHFSFILELNIIDSLRACIFLPENKGT